MAEDTRWYAGWRASGAKRAEAAFLLFAAVTGDPGVDVSSDCRTI
jgi:hypothetical protein